MGFFARPLDLKGERLRTSSGRGALALRRTAVERFAIGDEVMVRGRGPLLHAHTDCYTTTLTPSLSLSLSHTHTQCADALSTWAAAARRSRAGPQREESRCRRRRCRSALAVAIGSAARLLASAATPFAATASVR